MDTYFQKFPAVIYNNQPVVDITRRVVIANSSVSDPNLFYPLALVEGIRSDQLARKLYNDPYEEWVIFLSNQIIDPYNSWYMSQAEFNDFITQKYGSIANSQLKIMNYTNNWVNQNGITISAFDAIDAILQKYYQPTYDGYGQINGYVRAQQDWMVSTNHLVSFNFSNQIPAFINTEIVTITYSANQVGGGQVALSTNTTLNIQHVNGYYVPNGSINAASFSIVGSESNNTILLSNTLNVSVQAYDTITPAEDIFYSPVYYYDYEDSKNESNKILNIMQPRLVPSTSRNLQTKLNS